ncbi:MAG TPA: TolC family protein [Balneolaceae bacterium]
MKKLFFGLSIFLFSLPCFMVAQDTVKVSLINFIEEGLENSGQIDYARQAVNLAENRINQANSMRYLPTFELTTQHGLVPGVESETDLPDEALYLDPYLDNDWENWGIFTRANVTAIQPIFTWGALKNAVKAAKAAAVAAQEQFEMQKADIELRLFDLYQSYLLTEEILRLLDEAQNKIERVEEQIEESRESGEANFDYSELFKFRVFKSEFEIRAATVRKNAAMIQRIWNYVMQGEGNTVFVPEDQFLDPVPQEIRELGYYRSNAITQRSEIAAIEAGIDAAEYGLEATKSKNYPAVFLGITGSFAYTPNRPRQGNPFIINRTNYASAAVGIGIRQNLDFFDMSVDVAKSKVQYRQAKYLKRAAIDGIILEINEAYKNASLAKITVEKTDDALVTTKKWLRQEQLDYDFGIGEIKDLIDAMKKELELRVQLKQAVFEFNKNMAELYRKAGLPILEITNND